MPETMIKVTFVAPDGAEERAVEAAPGMTLLKLAHFEGIDLEGACGGQMACSTCHVIVETDLAYERLPPPTAEEEDMLDLAVGATATSRLACQITLTADLDGLRVRLPDETADARS